MIKSLELKNVQSHNYTKLDFTGGINVIIGSSNNGKSAILRGLNWVRTNRPLGTDTIASHWIFNDKNQLKDEVWAKLINENGTVTRRRTKEENQYVIDSESNNLILNVVKGDVPVQVQKTLRLSETNVQKQLDLPFLLSQTPGEIAKYFNKVVRLDVIDKVLTKTELEKRRSKTNINFLEKEMENLQNKLDNYGDWVDDCFEEINKIKTLKSQIEELENNKNTLISLISSYKCKILKIESYNKINKLSDTIEVLIELNKEVEKGLTEYREVKNSLKSFSKLNRSLYPSFENIKKYICKYIERKNEREEKIKLFTSLKHSLIGYSEKEYTIKECEQRIKELKTSLPKTCPLCGALL